MKNSIFYTVLFVFGAVLMACEENEIMPAFETKGTATHTVASIAVSKSSPAPAETVTVTMTFVSPSSDPVTQIVLKAKVGTADYVEVQTFNESSAPKNQEVTITADYVAPASGTTVVFDMVISSGKQYPQVKRTSMKVQ